MRETEREILIIENDARILDLMTRFLARRGYQVRRALSLEAAERELALHRPDMILSDLLVGHTNAVGRLHEWALAGKLPPTLVVSGCLDEKLRHQLAAIPPVVGTLSKPFRFEDLEAHIAAVLKPETVESVSGAPVDSQPSGTPCS